MIADAESSLKMSNSKELLAGEAQLNEIKRLNVTPLLRGNFIWDQYESYIGPDGPMDRTSNTQWGDSTLYSAYLFMEKHLHLIFISILLLALISLFSEDSTHRDLLFTLPTQKNTFYWNKMIYNFSSVVISCIGFMMIYIVVTSFIGGLGEWHYPVVVFDPKEIGIQSDYVGYLGTERQLYFHFESVGFVVMQIIVLMTAGVIFMISLATMLSLFIRNRFLALSVTFGIVGVGYFGVLNLQNNVLISYIPFVYLNSYSVVDGWLSHFLDNTDINVTTGTIVLLVWSSIIIVLSRIIYERYWTRY